MLDMGQLGALASAIGAGVSEYQRPKQSMFVDSNYAGNGLARTDLYQADLNANQRDPYDTGVMLGSLIGGNNNNIDFGKYGSILKGAFGNLGTKASQFFNQASNDGTVKTAIDKYVNGYPEDWGNSSVGQFIGEYMKGYNPYSDYSSPVSNAIGGYEPYLNNLGIYGGYQ